jgi:hypothetical protein
MKVFVLALALAAAAGVAGANGTAQRRAASCAWGAVPVRVGAATACLVDGHACRARYGAAYRRAGFACRAGVLAFDWSVLRRRAVTVPRVDPGGACPTGARTGSLPGYPSQPAWGDGPAWPFITGETERPRVTIEAEPGSDWGTHKIMWAIDPRYIGPVLVRGRQLDGANELRFENGHPAFTEQQRLHPVRELRLEGGSVHPATTRFFAPGCYAWRIDGIGFSRTIVFEAVPA